MHRTIIVIFFLLNSFCIGQIIKKVEEPKNIKAGVLQVSITWGLSEAAAKITVNGTDGTTSSGWHYGGGLSFSAAVGCSFSVVLSENLGYGVSDIIHCDASLNGITVNSGDSPVNGVTMDVILNFNVQLPTINLSFGWFSSQFCPGTTTPLTIDFRSDCNSTGSFTASDPITLEILTGNENVSFYKGVQYCGSSITIQQSEIDSVILKQSGFNYSGSEINGSIRVTAGSFAKTYNNFFTIPSTDTTHDLITVNTAADDTIRSHDETLQLGCYINDCSARLARTHGFYAEIIQGSQFGGLQLEEGSQAQIRLDSLYSWNSEDPSDVYFYYFSNGVLPTTVDSVIIKVGLIDYPQYRGKITLYIKPPALAVSFDPPQLAPGDTALVKIQKRNVDGTLEDFPPGQKFEAGIQIGCEHGTFLWLDPDLGIYTRSSYVPATYVPLKFIAQDSGTISIKVGAVDYYPAKKVKPGANAINMKNSIASGRKVKKTLSCASSQVTALYCAVTSALVGDCQTAGPGLAFFSESEVVLERHDDNNDFCQTSSSEVGYTKLQPIDWTDEPAKFTIYRIKAVAVNLFWGICHDKIRMILTGGNNIEFFHENSDGTFSIPDSKLKNALEDLFKFSFTFPQTGVYGKIKYYPEEETIAHELTHTFKHKSLITYTINKYLDSINLIKSPENWCNNLDQIENILNANFLKLQEYKNDVKMYYEAQCLIFSEFEEKAAIKAAFDRIEQMKISLRKKINYKGGK